MNDFYPETLSGYTALELPNEKIREQLLKSTELEIAVPIKDFKDSKAPKATNLREESKKAIAQLEKDIEDGKVTFVLLKREDEDARSDKPASGEAKKSGQKGGSGSERARGDSPAKNPKTSKGGKQSKEAKQIDPKKGDSCAVKLGSSLKAPLAIQIVVKDRPEAQAPSARPKPTSERAKDVKTGEKAKK